MVHARIYQNKIFNSIVIPDKKFYSQKTDHAQIFGSRLFHQQGVLVGNKG